MIEMKQYDVVRVRSIRGVSPEDSFGISKRSPRVGDTGAIVEILHSQASANSFVVEAVERDGSTLWLAEFPEEALEVIVSD